MSDTRLITVTFVDAATNATFLELNMPARSLPEAFDAKTVLDLGKAAWAVVSAEPAYFLQLGRLRLVVRKVEYVDPSKILFSLPTVADEIPQLEAPPADLAEPFALAEDDWLQLELVPPARLPDVRVDLEAISAVLAGERQGAGFRKLHVRKALPAPFARDPLRLAALEQRFGAPRRIRYLSGPGVLAGGFAFTLPSGAVLYGEARDGLVHGLGLSRPTGEASELGLALVDWSAASAAQGV